jgi:hypothetical protein
VRSEISKYFQWYPTISGIFFDRVSTACDNPKLSYYQGLVTHVRSLNPNAVVVFNWGSGALEWLGSVALNACTVVMQQRTACCCCTALFPMFEYIYHVAPSGLQPTHLLESQVKPCY